MTTRYSTILIIPCFNEVKRLDINFYNAFLSANPDYFILFVDDGSRDDTISILKTLQSASGNFDVLTMTKNAGKGEAVRQGMLHSLEKLDFDYVGFADADLSTPLNEFHLFRKKMQEEKHFNMVLGSRVQMLGKNISRSLARHWFGRIVATAIGKVIQEPVYDTQCGAKLFSKETAKDLFTEKFISKWLFDVELLSRYKTKHGSEKFRTTILEMPVNNWTEKQDSKLRYYHFFRILYDLLKIRKRYFRKK